MDVSFSINNYYKIMTVISLLFMLVMPIGSVMAQSMLGYEIIKPQPSMFSYINPTTIGLTKYPAQSGGLMIQPLVWLYCYLLTICHFRITSRLVSS